MRPMGSWAMTLSRPSAVPPVKRSIISVSMMPGQMALMRMFDAGVVEGGALGQPDDAVLRGAVGGAAGEDLDAGAGGGVDDRAAAVLRAAAGSRTSCRGRRRGG